MPWSQAEELSCPVPLSMGRLGGTFSGGRRRTETGAGHKLLGLRGAEAQCTVSTFVTLQPNEVGQENHARNSEHVVVRASARIPGTRYGLKAALQTPHFIRLKCYALFCFLVKEPSDPTALSGFTEPDYFPRRKPGIAVLRLSPKGGESQGQLTEVVALFAQFFPGNPATFGA